MVVGAEAPAAAVVAFELGSPKYFGISDSRIVSTVSSSKTSHSGLEVPVEDVEGKADEGFGVEGLDDATRFGLVD